MKGLSPVSEEWRVIPAYPKYEVGNDGSIRTIKTGRILQPSHNQQGHLKVNLVKNGETYTRNVNHIVAKAFLPAPMRPDFISIIHLDGNKENCSAPNLMWRPRYFAIKYHLQFETPLFVQSHVPVIDIRTGEKYARIQDAVVKCGLLFTDIMIATHELTYVWPTYQEFRKLEV